MGVGVLNHPDTTSALQSPHQSRVSFPRKVTTFISSAVMKMVTKNKSHHRRGGGRDHNSRRRVGLVHSHWSFVEESQTNLSRSLRPSKSSNSFEASSSSFPSSLLLYSLTPSSQLTVGTWLRLYSLAFSLRLAMLLAIFIPWVEVVLAQVGGQVAMVLMNRK